MKTFVLKVSGLFGVAILLMALTSGCTVSAPYGGAYAGVYGEYPSTYYNGYVGSVYTYPVYPHYHYWNGHYYRIDHDWDHGHGGAYHGGHPDGRARGHHDDEHH